MARVVSVFADTNYFLHHIDPDVCDWLGLFGQDVEEVRIIVGRQVQQELEKHKYEMRGRRQKRARKYARLLADIAMSDQPVVLREARPRVLLNYVLRPVDFEPPAGLKEQWADDQLVADVLAFNAEHPAAGATLLTNDPGLMARGKGFGVRVQDLPDQWELPPESDESQREIQRLRAELAEQRRRGPSLDMVLNWRDEPVAAAITETWWMPSLTAAQRAALLESVTSRFPMKSNLKEVPAKPPASGGSWAAPSDEAIGKYTTQYRGWRADLEAFVDKALGASTDRIVCLELDLDLTNTGVEPADDLRIVFELSGPCQFRRRPAKDDGKPIALPGPDTPPRELSRAPVPPSPPQPTVVLPPTPAKTVRRAPGTLDHLQLGRMTDAVLRPLQGMNSPTNTARMLASQFEHMTAVERLHAKRYGTASDLVRATNARMMEPIIPPSMLRPMRINRDPEDFHWVTDYDDRNDTARWEFECDRFVHHGRPESFDLLIYAKVSSTEDLVGELAVTVTARNQRETLRRRFPIRIKVIERDPVTHVRAALP